MTRTLTATILALALTLTACGGGNDSAQEKLAQQELDRQERVRQEVDWAACRTEHGTLETAIAYHDLTTGDPAPDLADLDPTTTGGEPRYWTVTAGEIEGVQDNADGTCGGTQTPSR